MSEQGCFERQIVAKWMLDLADKYKEGVPLMKFLGSIDVAVLPGHCDYFLDSDGVRGLALLLDPAVESEVRPNDGQRRQNCGAGVVSR